MSYPSGSFINDAKMHIIFERKKSADKRGERIQTRDLHVPKLQPYPPNRHLHVDQILKIFYGTSLVDCSHG